MVNVDNTLLKDAHLWNRLSKMRLAIKSINPSPLLFVLSLLFIDKEFVHIYLDVIYSIQLFRTLYHVKRYEPKFIDFPFFMHYRNALSK